MKTLPCGCGLGGGVAREPDRLRTAAENFAGGIIGALGEGGACPPKVFVEKCRDEFAFRAQKRVPPPMPPEYTPEELIEEQTIRETSLPRDPGWEKAGLAGRI